MVDPRLLRGGPTYSNNGSLPPNSQDSHDYDFYYETIYMKYRYEYRDNHKILRRAAYLPVMAKSKHLRGSLGLHLDVCLHVCTTFFESDIFQAIQSVPLCW